MRAARLEQNALIPLRQLHLRRGRPRLAAEALKVRGDEDVVPRERDDAGRPEDVRPIVRQTAGRVGEVVRILAERQESSRRLSC